MFNNIDRLEKSVGKKLAEEIELEGYQKLLLRVDEFGNVTEKILK